jgi:enterochelin esterase family protein
MAGLDVDTYVALGLNWRWEPRHTIGGRQDEDWSRFLTPPEDDQYHPCPEAFPASDVSRGSVDHIEGWTDTDVYAGTRRDIWVYRPAQLEFSPDTPSLMVFQDGQGYVDPDGAVRVPAVLDTLIHAGELPPTVAVFVTPGERIDPAAFDPNLGDQRSLEYDSLTDAYATFVLEEVLPFIEDRIGRAFALDPAQRLIGGISSGGIAAFTAAWHRPRSFGRVLSHCGSFANIRGGHNYPYLVRTTEPKPLRIFLTSGNNDLDHPVGNWPLANQQMASALEYAGYDYRFEFGEGGHSLRHGGSIIADSFRWLFR